jgi:hypothetical protein
MGKRKVPAMTNRLSKSKASQTMAYSSQRVTAPTPANQSQTLTTLYANQFLPTLLPGTLMVLQRTVGNRAVNRLLTRHQNPNEHAVEAASDRDEQETDSAIAPRAPSASITILPTTVSTASGTESLSIQREWLPEDDSVTLKEWSEPVDGLTWYYNTETRNLHYKISDRTVQFPPAIIEAEGRPYSYEEWKAAGWPGTVESKPKTDLRGTGKEPTITSVASTAHTNIPSGKVAVLSDAVSRQTLDAGSTLLAQLLAKRPEIVNNAKDVGSSSALSNCALATLAAITGDKTTSEVSIEWQRRRGGRSEATAQKPDPKLQSEKMWAMMMMPADLQPLEAEGFVLQLDQPDFPEGKAYVIGDSQFYGMLNYLLQLAGARSSGEVNYTVHQHGEPGNQMWQEAELLRAMHGYPNGTQFATFVYSSDPKQAVRAHWVYAEKFNSGVVFADYQKNESKERRKGGFSLQSLGLTSTISARQSKPHKETPNANPAAAYLGMFPLSPDPGDARKGLAFGAGCFIAFVPSFGDAPAKVADPVIHPGKLATILNGVQDRINILRESRKVGTADKQLPRDWGGGGGAMQLEIPSPALIEKEAIALASSFGISGAASELGHLTNPDAIRIVGHPAVEVTQTAPGGTLIMQNLNAGVKTIGEGGTETTGELPATGNKYEVGSSIEGAVAGVGTIMAQVTNQGIVFNAYLAQFTDIIHEALHTFERPSMPVALKEGATEIFAGMLSNRILARGKDPRFKYSYNPDYVRYILPVQQLVEIFGIQTLANMYFNKKGTIKDFWRQTIQARFPAASKDVVSDIVENLTASDGFPMTFYIALEAIKELATGAQPDPKTAGASDKEYIEQQTGFQEFLRESRASLLKTGSLGAKPEANLPDLTSSTDQLAIAERGSQAQANVRNERILVMLYTVRDQATGENYVDASKRIFHLEQNIAKWTGESPDVVRERLVQPMYVIFQTAEIEGVESREKLYLTGNCSELGNNSSDRALPMRQIRPKIWEVGVDTFLKRGKELACKVIAKGGPVPREVWVCKVILPSAKESVVPIIPS